MGRYKTTISLSVLFFFHITYCFAIVRVVNNSSKMNIQQTIDVSSAFDTVIVYNGTYKETSIVISKPLALIGKNKPLLDGQKKYEIISIFSSNVTIQGFEIRNSGISSMNDIAGIKIYKSSQVTIIDNTLIDTFFGIYFQECSNGIAKNNIINSTGRNEVQSGNGIHCWKSEQMQIVNNRITGHRDGIYFEFVTNSSIVNNISDGNIRYGLHFMFSHNDSYLKNTFQNNGAGVAVMYTHHVTMIENTFKDNWGSSSYGLLLKDISDSEIRHNKFIGNTSGIYLEGSNRNHIHDNVFLSNGTALKIQASCDNNVI